MLQRRELLRSMSAMAALTAMRVPDIWAATLDSTYKGVKLALITGTLTPLGPRVCPETGGITGDTRYLGLLELSFDSRKVPAAARRRSA